MSFPPVIPYGHHADFDPEGTASLVELWDPGCGRGTGFVLEFFEGVGEDEGSFAVAGFPGLVEFGFFFGVEFVEFFCDHGFDFCVCFGGAVVDYFLGGCGVRVEPACGCACRCICGCGK